MKQSSASNRTVLFNLRPVCSAGLGFAGGILLFERVAPLPLLAMICMTALLAVSFFARNRGRRGVFLFALFLSLGLLWAKLSAPPAFSETCGTLSGTVTRLDASEDGSITVLLKKATCNGIALPGRVEVRVENPPDTLTPGQTLLVDGKLSSVSLSETYRRYRQICGVFAPESDPVLLAGPPGLMGCFQHLRDALSDRIALLFPRAPGLAAAMLIGDRTRLDAAAAAQLYAAGIGHLVAVSGLHVGILALALSRLLPQNRQGLHFALMCCFLACYSLLCGLSASVVRASLMFLLYRLSILLKRPYDLASALAAAGLLILICNPASLFDAGFQLSFLAIYGLITLEPLFRPRLERNCLETGKLLSGSFAVTLSTLPASVALFSRISLFSIPANLIAIPLAAVFIIPGMAALLLSFLSFSLARLVAILPNLVLGAFCALSRVFAPGAVAVPALPTGGLPLCLLGLLLLSPLCLLPRGEKTRHGLIPLLVALLCALS